jgi:solute:Na+ symporter, SSS family
MHISIALYVGVSLLTCRQDYPINKMLHRDELPLDASGNPVIVKKPWSFARIIGVNQDFSRGDKWITGSLFVWSVGWFCVMILGISWNLLGQFGLVSWIKPWTNEAWLGFWHVTAIGLPILITIINGLWFTWGGVHDIRALFRSLKTYKIDDSDNGTVKDHKPY